MIVHEVAQRSPEWHALRLGRVTSSRAADMLAARKDKTEAAGRRNLRVQLMLERLVGRSMERDFTSQAMQDGIDREEQAGLLYEAITGRVLRPIGFVSHDSLLAGVSPDGVIGEFEGHAEFKCPIPATHWDYVTTGKVPDEYQKQARHGLWLMGTQWCDFVSYSPDFPEPLRMRIVRIHRDEDAVQAHEAAVRAFLDEVERELAVALTFMDTAGALTRTLEVA